MLVCSKCGNRDVQTLAWVNVNTNEYISDGPNDEVDDYWCSFCNTHVKIKEYKDYIEKKNNKNK